MKISDKYKGREHSLIKHELLKGYLEALLSIIGVTGKTSEIVYVDCFAGPWGDESESLSATSIGISLGILSKVRETLTKAHKVSNVRFRAIYIEEKKNKHKRLLDFLEQQCPEGIEGHALHGDYFELQDEILRICGQGSFAFFFIDPKGWKDISAQKLEKLLQRPKSEFLVTFMYDFVNRAIGMADFTKQVQEVLGPLTETDKKLLSSSKNRGDIVVRKYRDQLEAAMGSDGIHRARSYHADILNKEKDRVHYHMVYLTRHPKGIVKFAESSEKIDLFQRVVRIQTKKDASPQGGLFSAEEEAEQFHHAKVGREEVKSYWLEQLTLRPIRYDEARLADMLEKTGWLICDFQSAFADLLEEGKVENLDAAAKRSKHHVHFEKSERLRRCS